MRFYKAMQDFEVQKLVSKQLPAVKFPVQEHPSGIEDVSEPVGGYPGGHGQYAPLFPGLGTGSFGTFSSWAQGSSESPTGSPKGSQQKIPGPTFTFETLSGSATGGPNVKPQTLEVTQLEEEQKLPEPISPTSPVATASLAPTLAQDVPNEQPKTFFRECSEIYMMEEVERRAAFSKLIERFQFNKQNKCELLNKPVVDQLDTLLSDCVSFRNASQRLYVNDAAKFIKSTKGDDELAALKYAYDQEKVVFGLLFNEDITKRLKSSTYSDEITSNVGCYDDLTVGRLSNLYSIERAATIETFFTRCNTVWQTKNSDKPLNQAINAIAKAHNDAPGIQGQSKKVISYTGDVSEKFADVFKYRSKDCITKQEMTIVAAVRKYKTAYKTVSVSDFYHLLKRERIAGQLSINGLSDKLEALLAFLEQCQVPEETKSQIRMFVSVPDHACLTAVRIWKAIKFNKE